MSTYGHASKRVGGYVSIPKNVLEDMFSTYHKMESYIETLEILSDKELAEKISESRKQADKGELLGWEEFKKATE